MTIAYLSDTPCQCILHDELIYLSNINQVLSTKLDYSTIIIDLPLLYSNNDMDAIEILYLISTIARCNNVPIKIVGGIKKECPNAIIKQCIHAGIKCFIAVGDWGDTGENYNALENHSTYIPKLVRDKIKSYPDNEITLNPRQQQILQLITKRGLSNKMIGKILNISESSVKSNIGVILKKYGLRSRTQLAIHTKVL